MDIIKYKNDYIVFENINNNIIIKYKDIKQNYVFYSKTNAIKKFKKIIKELV
jgi:molybdopterin/thiamine biosynthesis adenylyltransferase